MSAYSDKVIYINPHGRPKGIHKPHASCPKLRKLARIMPQNFQNPWNTAIKRVFIVIHTVHCAGVWTLGTTTSTECTRRLDTTPNINPPWRTGNDWGRRRGAARVGVQEGTAQERKSACAYTFLFPRRSFLFPRQRYQTQLSFSFLSDFASFISFSQLTCFKNLR